MSHPLAIALGGNVGTEDQILARFRAAHSTLETALEAPLTASPVYRSEPVGPVSDQPSFLNAVLVGEDPELEPVALVAALLELETALGRDRQSGPGQGPRKIDLDLLLAGDEIMAMDGVAQVIVPHPRMAERAFVLRPLCDVLGEGYIPPGGEASIGEVLARIGEDGLERTELQLDSSG